MTSLGLQGRKALLPGSDDLNPPSSSSFGLLTGEEDGEDGSSASDPQELLPLWDWNKERERENEFFACVSDFFFPSASA